ncbi:MAG: AbrB/MazE/SpoVT family DNA-binding domain-containing protein [Candidatus Bathyarchaeia archaeon]|nr:AbrB/MazE/SpoVT family DNA-binding domain-containing protein [Candidatus Bathyarchaeota archaeon]
MPIEFEIKVVKVAGSLRMTIPKPVAKALSIDAGDTVLVTIDDNTMLVKKK